MKSEHIRHRVAIFSVLVLSLGAGWVLAGCGSGAGSAVETHVDTREAIDRPPSPIVTAPENTFNVTIQSDGGQFLVDKLEIEFNRRRGIHEFYGFYRDTYDQMARIPFRDLERVDFLDQMPPALFDQAIIGREQENLRQDHAFMVRLTFKDQTQKEFFPIIPKFRGEKDLQLWEFSMSSRNSSFRTILFDR